MLKLPTILALVAAGLTAPLGAQGRDRNTRSDDIPPAHRPPPGMCRVWINGVPPGQQPAPTDCRTAIRNRPRNARVIFGDDYSKRDARGKATLPELLKDFRSKDDRDERKDDDTDDRRKRSRKP